MVSVMRRRAGGNGRIIKAVLEGETCSAFVAGTLEGWNTLEQAAEQEGLL